MKEPRLKLTVRAIRALQEQHGIANLLQPTAEDVAKMANVDFLVSFYYEGSRGWEQAPTTEAIEELDIVELSAAVKAVLSGEPGNG